MKKDAYYFPHFSNARNDSKILKLRRILGIEGYGIYFMILELLREQTNYRLSISSIEDVAYEWHVSKEKIASVIADYDLFEINDNFFTSNKLILYMQPYLERSKRASEAARERWDKCKSNANALPEHSKCNASKVKKSKVKESKVNNIFSFNEFWNKYPVKVAKKDCEKKYNQLSNYDIEKIKLSLDGFIKHKPFSSYTHPNPMTYLNQMRWNDSITTIETKESSSIKNHEVRYYNTRMMVSKFDYDNFMMNDSEFTELIKIH